MRTRSRILSLVTAVALLVAGGPALYCAQASMHSMPCCKTSARCDLGMKAAACCTVEPSSGFPERTAGLGTGFAAPGQEKRPHAARSLAEAPAVDPVAAKGPARLWYPPAHVETVPAYLRHASILC
ncbi:MAG TPA: hypothetical protein VGV60_13490 [Candidatus Polarisedimenticolia bacterium]|jgi:hypothetical protein|nr:hypothetical protein [Candidatus Polarisedimenticolia bacterium]